MTLSEWLSKNGVTQEAFGQRIGLTQGRISQIVIAGGTGNYRTALAIEAATGGEVTLTDLIPADMKEEPAE